MLESILKKIVVRHTGKWVLLSSYGAYHIFLHLRDFFSENLIFDFSQNWFFFFYIIFVVTILSFSDFHKFVLQSYEPDFLNNIVSTGILFITVLSFSAFLNLTFVNLSISHFQNGPEFVVDEVEMVDNSLIQSTIEDIPATLYDKIIKSSIITGLTSFFMGSNANIVVVRELSDQITILQNDLASVVSVRDILSTKVGSLENRIVHYVSDIRLLEDTLQEFYQSDTVKTEKIGRLESKLVEYHRLHSATDASATVLNEVNSELSVQQDNLNLTNSDLNSANQILAEQNSTILRELEELRLENRDLVSQVMVNSLNPR